MSFPERKAIRLVACFEAFKGILVLLAASGLLTLIHRNVQDFAARLIEHAHLNPASKYPRIFLDAVGQLQDSRLVLLALGAAAYSAIRLAEAYGLYREKAWAEVLAAASGAIYMPIELYGWVRDPTWLHACIFVLNAAVVAVMLLALFHRRQAKPQHPAPAGRSVPGREAGKAL
jgi:uncharacterized membrane protein (DUF2068 family)